MTGDSTLTSLSCEGTITVDSYETTADTSGATASSNWSDYAVDRSESL